MPGCVLRVASKTKNVDPLMKASGLQPIVTYRKGDPKAPGSAWLWRSSGFNVAVSEVDGLERQARDAIRFLKRYAAGLSRLRRQRGFDGMTLDFGVYYLATEQRPWPSYRIPPALTELAGKHRIEIELSFYGWKDASQTSSESVRPR